MLSKVELHPAYTWDCDTCGRENFCRAIIAEMSEEDRNELLEEFGHEADADGHFTMLPLEVVCSHCGAAFETEPPV